MKKQLKLAIFALGILVTGLTNAQTTSGNIGKNANADLNTINGAVKVIDNKGTIKYLQSSNGITTFTDTNPDTGGEVTTWQLGGTLNATTTITTGGQNFTIDGAEFSLENIATTTADAATATTAQSSASNPSGWTVLVRDEQTGQIQKVLLADLLQVQTIGLDPDYSHGADNPIGSTDTPITVAGLPAITPGTPEEFKLFVFRNGAKLRLGVDFNVTANTVTILTSEVPMYTGDIIEVQYIR